MLEMAEHHLQKPWIQGPMDEFDSRYPTPFTNPPPTESGRRG